MIASLAILLACQLAGEAVARSLSLPVPGPVLGMVAFLAVLALRARHPLPVLDGVVPVSRFFLVHLSLLFVPAGVGVVGNLDILSAQWLALSVALAGSTLLTLVVSVAVFRLVARWMGQA